MRSIDVLRKRGPLHYAIDLRDYARRQRGRFGRRMRDVAYSLLNSDWSGNWGTTLMLMGDSKTTRYSTQLGTSPQPTEPFVAGTLRWARIYDSYLPDWATKELSALRPDEIDAWEERTGFKSKKFVPPAPEPYVAVCTDGNCHPTIGGDDP